RVGALRNRFAAELFRPVASGAEFRAPRPEPPRREMEPVFIGEADRAMNLMRDRGRDARRIVHADFCRRDLEGGIRAALVHLRASMIRDDAAGRRLRREYGELLLDRLELADGLAELRAL